MMSIQIPTLARGGGVGVSIDKCIIPSHNVLQWLKTKDISILQSGMVVNAFQVETFILGIRNTENQTDALMVKEVMMP